jgi:cytidyltransferase-like protein
MKVVLVTGGFDPLHSGHIEYFKAAKQLGDILCVGINSDEWLTRKKGRPFMHFEDRKTIVENIKSVGYAFEFDDQDDTAIKAIEHVKSTFPKPEVIFANGGDRTKDNVPEMVFDDVEFIFGVGGENKANSSSWILDEWKTQKTEREWGYWRVLDNKDTVKAKELVIYPGQSLSDQKHFHRNEHWYVLEGMLKIDIERGDIIQTNTGRDETIILKQHQTYIINREDWHRAYNPYDKPCHILEIQYGNKCVEEDIERRTIINKGMK